jgi:Na+-translocating ferredoxin:NAD+ oxidoreductase RnfG subunit
MSIYLIKHIAVSTAMISSAYATETLTIEQAQKIFFAQAIRFEEASIKLSSAQVDLIKEISGVRQRNNEQKLWRAYSKDKLLGWVLIDDVIGKHENITYATAVSIEGEVVGVEILTYRETHGHEIKRKDWRDKLKGKKLSDPFKLDVDVPNISGATLSSRNLIDGVKRMLAIHKVVLTK